MNNKESWKINPDKVKTRSTWWKSRSLSSSMALALGAIFFIVASAWYHFNNQSEENPGAIPVITAEAGPSKIRPENADEARMEHEDKLVYDRLTPSQAEMYLKERLLPEPEKPLTPEEYIQDIQQDTLVKGADEHADSFDQDELLDDKILAQGISDDDEMILADHVSENLDDDAPDLSIMPSQEGQEAEETTTFTQSDPEKITQEQVQSPMNKRNSLENRENVKKSLAGPPKRIKVELRNAKSTEAKKTSHKSELAEPVYSQKNVTSGYRVQIASVKTQQQAKAAWKQFENMPMLKGQSVQFKKVDLGAQKGIYYRVQVGAFGNRLDADNLCRRVKAAGKDCFVVKF